MIAYVSYKLKWASQVALAVKNPPANAGDLRHSSSTPGSGRSPGGESMANPSSVLAWEIPWREEPGGLQSTGSQKGGYDLANMQVSSGRLLYTNGYLSNPTHSSCGWFHFSKQICLWPNLYQYVTCLQTQVSSEESLFIFGSIGWYKN